MGSAACCRCADSIPDLSRSAAEFQSLIHPTILERSLPVSPPQAREVRMHRQTTAPGRVPRASSLKGPAHSIRCDSDDDNEEDSTDVSTTTSQTIHSTTNPMIRAPPAQHLELLIRPEVFQLDAPRELPPTTW